MCAILQALQLQLVFATRGEPGLGKHACHYAWIAQAMPGEGQHRHFFQQRHRFPWICSSRCSPRGMRTLPFVPMLLVKCSEQNQETSVLELPSASGIQVFVLQRSFGTDSCRWGDGRSLHARRVLRSGKASDTANHSRHYSEPPAAQDCTFGLLGMS